jgi:hypothetical protein
MSISQLEVPNSFNLFANSITTNEVVTPSNQIFWNSYESLFTPGYIGPGTEVVAFNNAAAITTTDITLTTLTAALSASPGIGNAWAFQLYVNNVPTALDVSVNDDNLITTNTFPVFVPAFSLFAIAVLSAGTPNPAFGSVTISYE